MYKIEWRDPTMSALRHVGRGYRRFIRVVMDMVRPDTCQVNASRVNRTSTMCYVCGDIECARERVERERERESRERIGAVCHLLAESATDHKRRDVDMVGDVARCIGRGARGHGWCLGWNAHVRVGTFVTKADVNQSLSRGEGGHVDVTGSPRKRRMTSPRSSKPEHSFSTSVTKDPKLLLG